MTPFEHNSAIFLQDCQMVTTATPQSLEMILSMFLIIRGRKTLLETLTHDFWYSGLKSLSKSYSPSK